MTLDGVDVLAMPAWERAAAGLHLVHAVPDRGARRRLDDVMTEALAARGRVDRRLDGVLAAEAARIGLPRRCCTVR